MVRVGLAGTWRADGRRDRFRAMAAATQFVDPRAQPATAVEPYELRWDPEEGASPTVGILVNNFPDSPLFGDLLEAAIAARLPGGTVRIWNKLDATSAAAPELVDEIVAAADVCISLIGTCGSCTGGTVRDAINIARRGRPSVALVTEVFREHGAFIATAAGMPDVPVIVVPHPIAGTGTENMRRVAETVVDGLEAALGLPLVVRA
jgi:hypothetical protein